MVHAWEHENFKFFHTDYNLTPRSVSSSYNFFTSKQLLWFVLVPSQPRDVTAKLDKDEISVTWKDPQDHNGIITKYSVSYAAKIRSISNLNYLNRRTNGLEECKLPFSLSWKLSCNLVSFFFFNYKSSETPTTATTTTKKIGRFS